MCETTEIPLPAAEINLIEEAIIKYNTVKGYEQLFKIKSRLEAGIGILSSIIASKSEVTEQEITEMNKVINSFLQILKGKRKIMKWKKEIKNLQIRI